MCLKNLRYICLLGFLVVPLAYSEKLPTYLATLDCENYETEEWKKKWMNPESKYAQTEKALCHLKEGREREGLDLLKRMTDEPHYYVGAAYDIAQYKLTGRDKTIDDEDLDETIEAYLDVFRLIERHSYYPGPIQRRHEYRHQFTLWSHYMVSFLSFDKFHAGVYGAYQTKLLNSTKYTGDKSKLRFYEQYRDRTKESLLQAEEYAGVCADLIKKDYFRDLHYDLITSSCKLIRDVTQELLALEDRRRESLKRCRDLTTEDESCPEYWTLDHQMMDLINTVKTNHKNINDRLYK